MKPKFRAWIKTEKRMIETCNLLDIDYENKVVMTQQVYFENGLPVDRDLDNFVFDEIDLMQSTGILDKNGKEIFEGDIVDYKGRKAVIKWHGSFASFIYRFIDELQERKPKWNPLFLAYLKLEIIGNIFENKELLEEKE